MREKRLYSTCASPVVPHPSTMGWWLGLALVQGGTLEFWVRFYSQTRGTRENRRTKLRCVYLYARFYVKGVTERVTRRGGKRPVVKLCSLSSVILLNVIGVHCVCLLLQDSCVFLSFTTRVDPNKEMNTDSDPFTTVCVFITCIQL